MRRALLHRQSGHGAGRVRRHAQDAAADLPAGLGGHPAVEERHPHGGDAERGCKRLQKLFLAVSSGYFLFVEIKCTLINKGKTLGSRARQRRCRACSARHS